MFCWISTELCCEFWNLVFLVSECSSMSLTLLRSVVLVVFHHELFEHAQKLHALLLLMWTSEKTHTHTKRKQHNSYHHICVFRYVTLQLTSLCVCVLVLWTPWVQMWSGLKVSITPIHKHIRIRIKLQPEGCQTLEWLSHLQSLAGRRNQLIHTVALFSAGLRC